MVRVTVTLRTWKQTDKESVDFGIKILTTVRKISALDFNFIKVKVPPLYSTSSPEKKSLHPPPPTSIVDRVQGSPAHTYILLYTMKIIVA